MSTFTYISAPLDSNVYNTQASATGQYIVAITSVGTIYYSSDYGQTFTVCVSPGFTPLQGPKVLAYGLAVDSSEYFICLGNSSNIGVSNDYGQTWTVQSTPTQFVSITFIVVGLEVIIGVDGTTTTYGSSDFGSNWATAPDPAPFNLDFVNGFTNFLIAISNNTLYGSIDAGYTWILPDSIPPQSGFNSACISADGTTIYAVVQGANTPSIIFSTDSSATWNSVNISPSPYVRTCDCSYDGLVACVSTDFPNCVGLYYTTNAGTTWKSQFAVAGPDTDNWNCTSVSGDGGFITSGMYGFGNSYSGPLSANSVYTFIPEASPPICYSEGTQILCESGYKKIEDLKPGDLVQTYKHGKLPIEYIKSNVMKNNPDKWAECMYKLPSKSPFLSDLIVTGGHGILKKNLSESEILADKEWFLNHKRYSMIDGMYLQRAAFSPDFVKITDQNIYKYYHLSLKDTLGKRYGIWANGILSESTFKIDMERSF